MEYYRGQAGGGMKKEMGEGPGACLHTPSLGYSSQIKMEP